MRGQAFTAIQCLAFRSILSYVTRDVQQSFTTIVMQSSPLCFDHGRPTTAHGLLLLRTGAVRRKHIGMCRAEVVTKLSRKLVKETKKKTVAREKAEENERATAASVQERLKIPDQEEFDDEPGPITAGGWLAPETRVMRRKARLMRGVRSTSVEMLEADEIGHISAGKRYVKAGRFSCPHPFGRRLVEDRWARRGESGRGDIDANFEYVIGIGACDCIAD